MDPNDARPQSPMRYSLSALLVWSLAGCLGGFASDDPLADASDATDDAQGGEEGDASTTDAADARAEDGGAQDGGAQDSGAQDSGGLERDAVDGDDGDATPDGAGDVGSDAADGSGSACESVCFEWVEPSVREPDAVTVLEDDVCRSLGERADGCPTGATCSDVVERWLSPTLLVRRPMCALGESTPRLVFEVGGRADDVPVTLAFTWNGAPWPGLEPAPDSPAGSAGFLYLSPVESGGTRTLALPTESDEISTRLEEGVYEVSFAPPAAFDAPYPTITQLGRLEVAAEGRVELQVVGGALRPSVQANGWDASRPLLLGMRTDAGFRRVLNVPADGGVPSELRVQAGTYTLTAADASLEGIVGRFAEGLPAAVGEGDEIEVQLVGRSVSLGASLEVAGLDEATTVTNRVLQFTDADGRVQSFGGSPVEGAQLYLGRYRVRGIAVLSSGATLNVDLGERVVEGDVRDVFTIEVQPFGALLRVDGEELAENASWLLDLVGAEDSTETRIVGVGPRFETHVADPGESGATIALVQLSSPALAALAPLRGEDAPWTADEGSQVLDVSSQPVTWRIPTPEGWDDPTLFVEIADENGRPVGRPFGGVLASVPTRVDVDGQSVSRVVSREAAALHGRWQITDDEGRVVSALVTEALDEGPTLVERATRTHTVRLRLEFEGDDLRDVAGVLNRGLIRYGTQEVEIPPNANSRVDLVLADAGQVSPAELQWVCLEALGCGLSEYYGVHTLAAWIGLGR